jgi:hypothetical protein
MLPDMDLFRNVLIETEKLPPGSDCGDKPEHLVLGYSEQ